VQTQKHKPTKKVEKRVNSIPEPVQENIDEEDKVTGRVFKLDLDEINSEIA